MKKILSLALTLVLMLSLSVSALANDVPVDGFIGFDEDTTDPESLIDVTISSNVNWFVYDTTPGRAIQSASFSIINGTSLVDLKVTLMSFTETAPVVTLPTNAVLTLNLVGALAADGLGLDIGDGYANATAYTARLTNSAPWTFSFGGTYQGPFPVTPIEPEYTMVLNFALFDE